ncbi:MAG: hypothetical protein OSB69_20200 [Alphaproteobacteria bacterium]|nr:hypothetical protein [Alphaproteobacteria bacterium]
MDGDEGARHRSIEGQRPDFRAIITDLDNFLPDRHFDFDDSQTTQGDLLGCWHKRRHDQGLFTRGSPKKLAPEATLAKSVGNRAAARTVLRDKPPSVRAPFVLFYFSPLVGARAMTGFATSLVAMESRDGAMSLTGDALSVLVIRIVPGPMSSLDLDRLPRGFLV